MAVSSPTTSRAAIQATTGLDELPIGPWAGLGVLAGYDEVEVVEEGATLRIVPKAGTQTRGRRLVGHMRGRGTARETRGLSTDQLMALLRGE